VHRFTLHRARDTMFISRETVKAQSEMVTEQRVSSADAKPVSISVDDAVRVSGLLQAPAPARACYVLAHGAGAGRPIRS